jgi:hypothetical protein
MFQGHGLPVARLAGAEASMRQKDRGGWSVKIGEL